MKRITLALLFALAMLIAYCAGASFDQWVYNNTRPEPENRHKTEQELWPTIDPCDSELWDCIRGVTT